MTQLASVNRMLEYYEDASQDLPDPAASVDNYRRRLQGITYFGLLLFEHVARVDAEWSADYVAQQPGWTQPEHPSDIRGLYLWWLRCADRHLSRLNDAAHSGTSIDAMNEFRRAYLRAKTKVTWNLGDIDAAVAEMKAGGGRPFDDVLDEIRRANVD